MLNLIEKWELTLGTKPDGSVGIRPLAIKGKGKATDKQFQTVIAEIEKFGKANVIAELQKIKARNEEKRAARQTEIEVAETAKRAAIISGEEKIELSYSDGEYLSGYAVCGQSQKLLEELGLCKYVADWGYHADHKLIMALGNNFTYAQAVEFAKPALDEKAAKKATKEADVAAKFAEAKETGEPVLLQSWTEDCNDPHEECSTDTIMTFAMPDGTRKTQRHHTW